MGCYIRRIEYVFPKRTENINDIKKKIPVGILKK